MKILAIFMSFLFLSNVTVLAADYNLFVFDDPLYGLNAGDFVEEGGYNN